MRRIPSRILATALLAAGGASAFAEGDDTLKFFEEEAKVVIASRSEQKAKQAPSIVSVISREDIERYGARDLEDILRHVPGFEFGIDVVGVTGLSFRGIWAHEGKSLLMINGLTQNEFGFGNYNFFGSIPASMIEKVEIIRGPGSAIYGGFAEVDVINVITHQPGHLNGARVTGDVGAVGHGGSSRFGSVSYGSETDALRLAAHVGYGTQPLSTRDYEDFSGNKLRLNQDTAYRRWQHIVTEASAKNLTVRYQRTSLNWGAQDSFTTVQPQVNGMNLNGLNNYHDVVHVDYNAKVSDRLALQPLLEYYRDNTFSFDNTTPPGALYEGPSTKLWRYQAQMSFLYDASWSAQLMGGGGYISDEVESVATDGTPGLQLSSDPGNLSSRVRTSSTFGLFQYSQQIDPVGLTLGGRYEDTSFGNAFAPRAGLTYTREAFNAKLLYGRAFRIPSPWQAFSREFGFNGGLRPETANSAEMELGYRFTPHVVARVNPFFVDIRDPIVFQGQTNTYSNFGRIQSEGAEAEVQVRYPYFGGFANASYAVPGRGTSAGFSTQSKRQFLASPPVKLDAGVYYKAGKVEYAPSVTVLSRRAGQSRASANDPNGILATTDYPTLALANMNVIVRDVVKGVDVHLAAHNIFDARYTLIQPYYGAHAPMPAQDREIDLGVTWRP